MNSLDILAFSHVNFYKKHMETREENLHFDIKIEGLNRSHLCLVVCGFQSIFITCSFCFLAAGSTV